MQQQKKKRKEKKSKSQSSNPEGQININDFFRNSFNSFISFPKFCLTR